MLKGNLKSCVEFISYTGKYPNLCRGVLTLKIDNEVVKFGHELKNYDWKNSKYNDSNYNDFWSSGGGININWCPYQDEWIINVEDIPEKYRKYAIEIDHVFNENVPHGCCGGCA